MACGCRGKKRAASFSFRLTFEERAWIAANAGAIIMGVYSKSMVLADEHSVFNKASSAKVFHEK
jgi:hypothetical protein